MSRFQYEPPYPDGKPEGDKPILSRQIIQEAAVDLYNHRADALRIGEGDRMLVDIDGATVPLDNVDIGIEEGTEGNSIFAKVRHAVDEHKAETAVAVTLTLAGLFTAIKTIRNAKGRARDKKPKVDSPDKAE